MKKRSGWEGDVADKRGIDRGIVGKMVQNRMGIVQETVHSGCRRVKGKSRNSQHAKSMDIHAIEIQEAKECLNFLQGRGLFPVLYALDFDRVHGDRIFSDDNAKVFNFDLLKLALLWFEIKIVDCKDAQHIVYYTMV